MATTIAAAAGEGKVPGKKETVKVKRYWAGKAPEYAKEEEEPLQPQRAVHVFNAKDPRLQRLSGHVDRSEALERRRELHRAEVVEDDEEEEEVKHAPAAPVAEVVEDSDEEDIDIDEKRRRAREKRRAQEEEEDADALARLTLPGADEPVEDEEGSSEYESEYESDDGFSRPTIAPVFVKKDERDTIAEREALEQKEAKMEEERAHRLVQRKAETHTMVKEELAREAAEAAKKGDDGLDPPDTDEDDEEAAFETWKLRELTRLKRDKEAKERRLQEEALVERRRKMTDAQIMAEDPDRFKPKEKDKYKFLQKYYHKGAFHQDILGELAEEKKHNYSAPTLEDRFDKALLPSVMQVKNFGRSGRTKYTHLLDQDTTKNDALWAANPHLVDKYKNKMGGVGSLVDAPAPKKRKA